MSDDVEGPRAVFLETLSEHIAALSALEAKICSLLMKEMDLEDEARGVVERLIVYVTTEFPVTEDEENWDESAASELIDRAQAVSEKFLAFYELASVMTPSDFERISRLRQELKQAIELLSASQKPSVTSPVLQPVSSRPVSSMNSKKGGGSGLGAIPSVRRAQSSVLARTSLGSVEDSDGTPTPSPKSLRAPTTAATRTSWLARRSSVVPSAPTSSSAPGPVAAHPLMFTQEVDHSSIAARIYPHFVL